MNHFLWTQSAIQSHHFTWSTPLITLSIVNLTLHASCWRRARYNDEHESWWVTYSVTTLLTHSIQLLSYISKLVSNCARLKLVDVLVLSRVTACSPVQFFARTKLTTLNNTQVNSILQFNKVIPRWCYSLLIILWARTTEWRVCFWISCLVFLMFDECLCQVEHPCDICFRLKAVIIDISPGLLLESIYIAPKAIIINTALLLLAVVVLPTVS